MYTADTGYREAAAAAARPAPLLNNDLSRRSTSRCGLPLFGLTWQLGRRTQIHTDTPTNTDKQRAGRHMRVFEPSRADPGWGAETAGQARRREIGTTRPSQRQRMKTRQTLASGKQHRFARAM